MSDFATGRVVNSVIRERWRQEEKCAAKRDEGHDWLTCADPRNTDGTRLTILLEEVGEVAQELNDARGEGRPIHLGRLRNELVQVAAVAVAWCEAIDVDIARWQAFVGEQEAA
jgi:NTP pyrophosphatase (non-canonical NTP hydrolase)